MDQSWVETLKEGENHEGHQSRTDVSSIEKCDERYDNEPGSKSRCSDRYVSDRVLAENCEKLGKLELEEERINHVSVDQPASLGNAIKETKNFSEEKSMHNLQSGGDSGVESGASNVDGWLSTNNDVYIGIGCCTLVVDRSCSYFHCSYCDTVRCSCYDVCFCLFPRRRMSETRVGLIELMEPTFTSPTPDYII